MIVNVLISFLLTSRRCARRTRRWRCWWIRWGTCCGTSTPCWRWGNDSNLFFYFSMFFCPFFFWKRVLQRGWRSEEENFGFKARGDSQLCWFFTTRTEPAVELGALLLGHILGGPSCCCLTIRSSQTQRSPSLNEAAAFFCQSVITSVLRFTLDIQFKQWVDTFKASGPTVSWSTEGSRSGLDLGQRSFSAQVEHRRSYVWFTKATIVPEQTQPAVKMVDSECKRASWQLSISGVSYRRVGKRAFVYGDQTAACSRAHLFTLRVVRPTRLTLFC